MKRSYLLDQEFKPLSQKDGELLLIKMSDEKRDRIQPINIETYLK